MSRPFRLRNERLQLRPLIKRSSLTSQGHLRRASSEEDYVNPQESKSLFGGKESDKNLIKNWTVAGYLQWVPSGFLQEISMKILFEWTIRVDSSLLSFELSKLST